MQSICWTTRLVTRALRSGFSTLVEPSNKVKPHFVSVACGFPKDFLRSKYKLGRFGEDSWFIASTQNADVIGKWKRRLFSSSPPPLSREKSTNLFSFYLLIACSTFVFFSLWRFFYCIQWRHFFSLCWCVMVVLFPYKRWIWTSALNRRNVNAQVTKGVLVLCAFHYTILCV